MVTASDQISVAIALINAERTDRGRTAYATDARLNAAAAGHSAYMAGAGKLSHTGAGGSNPRSRVTAQGYQGCYWSENIAAGFSTPEALVAGWMGSSKHRENILGKKATHIGLGQVNGYWTAVFSAPC